MTVEFFASIHSSNFIACTSGVADVKDAVAKAKNELALFQRQTVLFIDEVHRFNKMQQVTENQVSCKDFATCIRKICMKILAQDVVAFVLIIIIS